MTTQATTIQGGFSRQTVAEMLNAGLARSMDCSEHKTNLLGIAALCGLTVLPLMPRCSHELARFSEMATARLYGMPCCPAWLYFGLLETGLVVLIAILSGLKVRACYTKTNQEGSVTFTIPLAVWITVFLAAYFVLEVCTQAMRASIGWG